MALTILKTINLPSLIHEPIAHVNGRPVYMNDQWKHLFQQLITQLQQNYSYEGITIPHQPTATATSLLSSTTSIGSMLYDNESHAFKGNVNGTIRTFTVT